VARNEVFRVAPRCQEHGQNVRRTNLWTVRSLRAIPPFHHCAGDEVKKPLLQMIMCVVASAASACSGSLGWGDLLSSSGDEQLVNVLVVLRGAGELQAPSRECLDRLIGCCAHANSGVRYHALRLLAFQPGIGKERFFRAALDSDSDCRIAALLGVAAQGWDRDDSLRFVAMAQDWPIDGAFDLFSGLVMERDAALMEVLVSKWGESKMMVEKAARLLAVATDYPSSAALVAACRRLVDVPGMELVASQYLAAKDRR
jgi:hypothetical protein